MSFLGYLKKQYSTFLTGLKCPANTYSIMEVFLALSTLLSLFMDACQSCTTITVCNS